MLQPYRYSGWRNHIAIFIGTIPAGGVETAGLMAIEFFLPCGRNLIVCSDP